MIQNVLLHFFHHSDSTVLLQCNSTKHPCKHGILWSYSHCIGFCFKCQCMWWYKESSNLLLKEFTDIVITDITAGHENWCFAEIGPCTLYPLYGKWKYWYACLIWYITVQWLIHLLLSNQPVMNAKVYTFTVALVQSFVYLTNILAGSYS